VPVQDILAFQKLEIIEASAEQVELGQTVEVELVPEQSMVV